MARGLSSGGAWAQLLRGMWNLPGPGLKPMSPALAGGFLASVQPGKSLQVFSSVPLTFAGHKWKFSASGCHKKGLLPFSNTNSNTAGNEVLSPVSQTLASFCLFPPVCIPRSKQLCIQFYSLFLYLKSGSQKKQTGHLGLEKLPYLFSLKQ